MTLSQEDGQLYYKLWLPLLDYVNGKYQVSSQLKNIATAKVLDPEEVKKVANTLWSDETIIDEYLKEREELPEEQAANSGTVHDGTTSEKRKHFHLP